MEARSDQTRYMDAAVRAPQPRPYIGGRRRRRGCPWRGPGWTRRRPPADLGAFAFAVCWRGSLLGGNFFSYAGPKPSNRCCIWVLIVGVSLTCQNSCWLLLLNTVDFLHKRLACIGRLLACAPRAFVSGGGALLAGRPGRYHRSVHVHTDRHKLRRRSQLTSGQLTFSVHVLVMRAWLFM